MMTEIQTMPLASRSTLGRKTLEGEVVVVTGAGRGIGYEAASALLWLGARVVLAEVDEKTGREASEQLLSKYDDGSVLFIRTDVGNEEDVARLGARSKSLFGKVDAVINNATAEKIGAVKDTPVDYWDLGYHVDLRGPVLLAREFLPGMVQRNHGVFVCVSSSGAAPFMGPYEVFKTAQVELASTIAAEVEGTGVHAFTIGPGIVRTPGFLLTGSRIAALMGITIDELIEMNKSVLLTPEEAGLGFAASIALASKYHGSETSSIQVLRNIGIGASAEESRGDSGGSSANEKSIAFSKRVAQTYEEQFRGWKERSIFQRQWVFRDFKKHTGLSVDEILVALNRIAGSLEERKSIARTSAQADTLGKLAAYYKHQQDLLRGFEKDSEKLKAGVRSIQSWIDEVQELLSSLP
ncbi:MAG TPA: SDR family oxidoreductase [Nitrososphaerales archaeon]|nr:SDR family oxidoreductase [Nitrososphaerales archaeon]